MKTVKFLLLCYCTLVFLISYAQEKARIPKNDTIRQADTIMPLQDSFVHLSGKVKLIDSQYILILTISVSGNNEISIQKLRYFDQGENTIASNRIFLNKWVRNFPVHIYTTVLKHPLFTNDWDNTIKLTKQTLVTDTVNLASFYPFETGLYSISAEIDYWHKSVKHTAQSKEIPFTVSFVPKLAPFN